MWYPRSGVVLDCIVSFLTLNKNELFCTVYAVVHILISQTSLLPKTEFAKLNVAGTDYTRFLGLYCLPLMVLSGMNLS